MCRAGNVNGVSCRQPLQHGSATRRTDAHATSRNPPSPRPHALLIRPIVLPTFLSQAAPGEGKWAHEFLPTTQFGIIFRDQFKMLQGAP